MNDKKDNSRNKRTIAPSMDEKDSFGRDATEEEIDNGESTTVTRLVFDDNEPDRSTDYT